MKTGKKNITQLAKKDIEELAAVTNLEPGFLLTIEKNKGKVVIGVDSQAFKIAFNGFFRNYGCSKIVFAAPSAYNCTTVPFDPPS